MKVSIIIPIYNVSLYIERCLDSVFRQSYSNIECILVDDASPDDSIEKIDKWLSTHSSGLNIRIITHSSNKGLSVARNTGVKNSTGDYIYFLDSDDEITSECIEKLVSYLDKLDADIVIGELSVVGNNRKKYSPLLIEDGVCLTNKEILNTFLKREWYEMAWNKLVKREMFFEKSCWFCEGIVHEDNLWSFHVALKSQSMIVCKQSTYLYHINCGTITAKKKQKNFDSMLLVIEEIIDTWSANRELINQQLLCHYLMNLKFYFAKNIILSNCDKLYMKEKLLQLLQLFNCKLFDDYTPSLLYRAKNVIFFFIVKCV